MSPGCHPRSDRCHELVGRSDVAREERVERRGVELGNRAPARLQSEMPPTIRAASFKELPNAVVRSARYRSAVRRFERLVRDPGPPSFESQRYRAFRQIQSRANDAYDPAPAAFPATLVLVDGSDALRRCGQLMPDLVVRDLGGAHDTMLVPPYVEELAVMVAAAAQDCFASKPVHGSV